MHYYVLAQEGPSAVVGFLPIIVILGIFYLLIYRPMKKRQRSHENLVQSLKNGDRVVTAGGIHGIVAGIREHTILLKVSEQVKLEVTKGSVASLQAGPEGKTSK